MPKNHEEEEESTLWAGRGGDPNGDLNPEVSQLLEAAIRDGNAVNDKALRLFCDHVSPKVALDLLKRRGGKYWADPAGDVPTFVRKQAAEALKAISQASGVEAAVQAVGAIENVSGSRLGIHFFETATYLQQSNLKLVDGVIALELLCALRKNEFNSIKDPDSSLTAREIFKALAAVAKASGVTPRVEIKFQPVPPSSAQVMPKYILVLEAILVPGLDGALVIGKVVGDRYKYRSNINIHAFALNKVEPKLRAALQEKCREVNAAILNAIPHNFAIFACGNATVREVDETLKLLSGDARGRLVSQHIVAHPSVLQTCIPKRVEFVACAEIKISRRLRAESSRHLHAIDATSARWRGGASSSPLDRASTAASSPGNDLVKNYRCTRRTG